MNIKTSILLLLVALVSAPALAELRVFSCEPEWAALVAEIGAGHVEVDSAITGQQDVHYIQARPSLISKVRRADLVICTGAELEIGWLPVLLRQAGNRSVQPGQPGFLDASQFVELLEKPVSLDRAEGDIHPYGNPHIQMDPRNIALVAQALTDRLASLDPRHADEYRAHHDDFATRWASAIGRWDRESQRTKGMAIVTHHRSWVYLVNWLGLDEVGNLEPKPGIEPGAAHLARLLTDIEGRDVRLIGRSAYQSPRASEWLSRRTGIPAVILPHTVGSVPEAEDLFSWFDTLIDRLTTVADPAESGTDQ